MIRFPPRRIFAAVDFSEPSDAAWAAASDWKRRFKSELRAVHVHWPPPLPLPTVPQAAWETPAALRKRLADRLGDDRLEILEGDPAVTLLRVIRTRRPDLVVMGTHGRAGMDRLLLGSVAERVIRDSPVPVLALHDWMKPVATVLCPVNFTPYAGDAFTYAAAVAAALGARLSVLHLNVDGESYATSREKLESLSHELPAEIRDACRPRPVVTRGPALDAIARAAAGHDLVVLAEHRKGIVSDMLGTTAERVLRLIRAPLVTVPARRGPKGLLVKRWRGKASA